MTFVVGEGNKRSDILGGLAEGLAVLGPAEGQSVEEGGGHRKS